MPLFWAMSLHFAFAPLLAITPFDWMQIDKQKIAYALHGFDWLYQQIIKLFVESM